MCRAQPSDSHPHLLSRKRWLPRIVVYYTAPLPSPLLWLLTYTLSTSSPILLLFPFTNFHCLFLPWLSFKFLANPITPWGLTLPSFLGVQLFLGGLLHVNMGLAFSTTAGCFLYVCSRQRCEAKMSLHTDAAAIPSPDVWSQWRTEDKRSEQCASSTRH